MKLALKRSLWLTALPLSLSYSIGIAQTTTTNPPQQASVVRQTDLKAQAFSDAATLKVLPENSKLDVLSRKASWMEVKAQGTLGWVKMLSLRFDNKIEANNGIGVIKGLFDASKSGGSSSVTTGAKGFDKEKFSNPTPNPQALANMKQFNSSKAEASNFAKQEKLNEQQQAYLKAAGDKS